MLLLSYLWLTFSLNVAGGVSSFAQKRVNDFNKGSLLIQLLLELDDLDSLLKQLNNVIVSESNDAFILGIVFEDCTQKLAHASLRIVADSTLVLILIAHSPQAQSHDSKD